MAIVSLSRNATQSAVTSRENAADRFQQKDNCRKIKRKRKNMKRWWFPKNEEKMMGRKIQNKCLLDVLKFYSNNENE